MIVTLTLVFCLTTRFPADADIHPVPPGCQMLGPTSIDGFAGFVGCQLRGEEMAAAWLVKRPKWRLWRITCMPGNPPRQENS
jgi:hypothetical protein